MSFYKLIKTILLGMLGGWISTSVFANADLYAQCDLQLDKTVIDYGQVIRENLQPQDEEQASLPASANVLRIHCPEAVEPVIVLEGMKDLNQRLRYTEQGYISFEIMSLKVDQQVVDTKILRRGIEINSKSVLPDDEIRAKHPIKGSLFELNFFVTPSIHLKNLILNVPQTLTEDIGLSLGKQTVRSFTVMSTLAAIACQPSLANGAVVDYGEIDHRRLHKGQPTVLEAKTIGFSIACDGKTKIAIKAFSNRPSTATDIEGTEGVNGSAKASSTLINAGIGQNLPLGISNTPIPIVAGLGKASNGKNIGGYTMALPFSTVSINGTRAASKFYANAVGGPTSSTAWTRNTSIAQNGDTIIPTNETYYSYATTTTATSPEAFNHLTGTIIIQAYITAVENLNLSQPIQLDGSATIELFYF